MINVKWSLVYVLVSAVLCLSEHQTGVFVTGEDSAVNFTSSDTADSDYHVDSPTTANEYTFMTDTDIERDEQSVESQPAILINTTSIVIATAAPDEGFIPPIFIINLDRAKSRWEKVSTTMRNAGLADEQFTRLSAVDGRTLSLEELQNQSTKLAMFLQPRGVIGCYLSHRKFWQYVVDQRLQRAIVLEDDISLVGGFKVKLMESMRKIDPEDAFDVLFLGAIGMHVLLVLLSTTHTVPKSAFAYFTKRVCCDVTVLPCVYAIFGSHIAHRTRSSARQRQPW